MFGSIERPIITINFNNTYDFIANAQNLLSAIAIIFYDYLVCFHACGWETGTAIVAKLINYSFEQFDIDSRNKFHELT